MSKGNKRSSNREAKKPKKIKEKAVATADFSKSKASVLLSQTKKK